MVKNLFRQLTPPLLFSMLRSLYKHFNVETPIYEGLYRNQGELPSIDKNPFAHPNWIAYVGGRARSRMSGVTDQDMREMCLSLIGSIMPATSELEPQTIVDFGGGVGMYWPALMAQNKAEVNTEFLVIDNESNCIEGKRLFGDQGVDFQSNFTHATQSKKNINVLNVASTLHYCMHYENVVAMLCGIRAKFIVVSRHPAPDDALPITYTVQNVTSIHGFCGQIPVVLLGVDTLSGLMKKHGYTLIADYYSDADPEKYWKYAKKTIPAEFARIIDHALVFQCTQRNGSLDTSQTS